MPASPNARSVFRHADPRSWAWWQLPPALRGYIFAVTVAALALSVTTLARTQWTAHDIEFFVILSAGGLIAVAATPRTAYVQGTATHDFIIAWILPVAVLLPPAYATLAPVPLLVLTQIRINRGLLYRRIFTVAALSAGYGTGSILFHSIPASAAGPSIGTGRHALTWVCAAIACEITGGWGHRLLIHLAIKIADPSERIRSNMLNREALTGGLAEDNLGIVITILVAVTPAFVVLSVPLWQLVRRFMVYTHLLTRSRTDTKTGLLNSSAWEHEATAEIARALRLGAPLSVALIDIDHFKRVNDTHGHLAGDVALRAVSQAIRDHLRGYDLPGRFGGEEFIILLPSATQIDAFRVAERLRTHIAAMLIPITEQGDDGPCITLTISAGVAALDDTRHELTNLVAAADQALYQAKQDGRNRTQAATPATSRTPRPSPGSPADAIPPQRQ